MLILKRYIFIILILFSLFTFSYCVFSEELERGIWVWNATRFMEDEKEMEDFFNFIEAPHGDASRKIDAVYLQLPALFKNNFEKCRVFIRKASLRDISVEHLSGDPVWSYQHSTPFVILDSVIEYNKSVEPEERFSGMHWDVEGHCLPVFNDPKYKTRITAGYIELLQKCREKLEASGTSLKLTVDLPTFYDQQYFAQVCRYVDCIVLMDYRDSFNRIVLDAENALKAAKKNSCQIVVGVETQKPTPRYGVTPGVTFYEEGYIKMNEILDEVIKRFSSESAFSGVAIHHYNSYLTMSAGARKYEEDIKYPELDEMTCIFNDNINVDGRFREGEWEFSSPVVIDSGNYVVYGKDGWKDKDDLSAIIRTGWDETNLYLALEIKDDYLIQNKVGADLVNGDHLEVWVDADYENDIDCPVPNEDDFQFGFSPGNFSNVEPCMILWFPEALDISDIKKEVKYVFKKTEVGYDTEIAIPWNILGVKEVKDGKRLRINIDPSDTDESELQECLMSTSPHRKFGNPRTFRVMVLKRVE